MNEIDLLTIADIMKLAKCSRSVAYQMAHEIGITRVGNAGIRVQYGAFREYIDARTDENGKRRRRRSIAAIKSKLETITQMVDELE